MAHLIDDPAGHLLQYLIGNLCALCGHEVDGLHGSQRDSVIISSLITHIGHIRGQECDRLHAMSEELTKRGITCTEEPDAITIKPGTPFPGIVSTYEDHRVAMSFALLGLKVDGIVIDNPSCCRKTFENYFDLLDQLSCKHM